MTAVLLVLGAAFAFDQADQVDSYRGCIVRIGVPLASGIEPLRAECHWTDVTATHLQRVLSRYDDYGAFVNCMKEVEVRREELERTLVWQFHRIGWGLSPRESLVWIEKSASKGWAIRWQSASEPFTPRQGSIVVPQNTGLWDIVASADGGVDVVQELLVDPGGEVPLWVVNWFQTVALADELKQLHTLAVADET